MPQAVPSCRTKTAAGDSLQPAGALAGGNVPVPFSSAQVLAGTAVTVAIGGGVTGPAGRDAVVRRLQHQIVRLRVAGVDAAGACRTQNEIA